MSKLLIKNDNELIEYLAREFNQEKRDIQVIRHRVIGNTDYWQYRYYTSGRQSRKTELWIDSSGERYYLSGNCRHTIEDLIKTNDNFHRNCG